MSHSASDTRSTPEFYTPAEVAEILKLSTKTVHRRIDDGTLRAVRIGGSIRIPAEVIDELLNPEEVNQ